MSAGSVAGTLISVQLHAAIANGASTVFEIASASETVAKNSFALFEGLVN